MDDFDRFERRLAAALRTDADMSVAGFEPGSIARTAIATAGPRPLRVHLGRELTFSRPGRRVVLVLASLGLVVALVIGALAAGAVRTRPADPSGWTSASQMLEARSWHSATLLPGGTVLVAGGNDGDALASAELYDPGTGSWVATGSLAGARSDHTATLLPGGKVLVAGGNGGDVLASAELYDPGTGSWVATGSMAGARSDHSATLLPDGRVLVAGGFGVASAELYDPKSGTWAPTGAMIADRAYHTATLLPDGRVLVVGGFGGAGNFIALASTEIYDPVSGTWTLAAPMAEPRAGQAATLLPGGQVLVTGGSNAGDSFHPSASAELYDPGTGLWTATGSMNVARVYAAATLLSDGSVLVAGGSSRTSNSEAGGFVAVAELYDPDSGSWTPTSQMTESRTYPTATLLKDGTVLVTGGRTKPVLGASIASAERYGPQGETP